MKGEESRADNVKGEGDGCWLQRSDVRVSLPGSLGCVSSMMSPLRRIRGCRVIPVVLALAWLPYIGTRCIQNPVTHTCPISAAHAHSSQAATSGQQSHCHGAKHAPARSCCCDLAGKCDIKGSSAVPSPASALVVAALPVVTCGIVLDGQSLDAPALITLTHGPPTYLRNLTLRI